MDLHLEGLGSLSETLQAALSTIPLLVRTIQVKKVLRLRNEIYFNEF